MRRVVLILLAFLLAQPSIPQEAVAAIAVEAPQVSKHQGTSPDSTIYSVSGPECDIAWTVRRFGGGEHFGVAEHSRCRLPLKQQDPFRGALLQQLAADTDGLRGLKNFYWGRLQRGDAGDVLASRLAIAAANSSRWDHVAGAVKQFPGTLNRFVGGLLNDAKVFSDIDSTFARFGYAVRVNSVEKVLVKASGGGEPELPKGRYPVDCLVSMEVVRLP